MSNKSNFNIKFYTQSSKSNSVNKSRDNSNRSIKNHTLDVLNIYNKPKTKIQFKNIIPPCNSNNITTLTHNKSKDLSNLNLANEILTLDVGANKNQLRNRNQTLQNKISQKDTNVKTETTIFKDVSAMRSIEVEADNESSVIK